MDDRKKEGELHLLGNTTVYRQDYAPEVLEAFTNKHPKTIIGYGLTVLSSPACVRLRASLTLLLSISITFLISRW